MNVYISVVRRVTVAQLGALRTLSLSINVRAERRRRKSIKNGHEIDTRIGSSKSPGLIKSAGPSLTQSTHAAKFTDTVSDYTVTSSTLYR